MNILIIDDDELILKALAFKLAEKGHDIYVASNGSVAVDIVVDKLFDLIICDLMMPIISGATFLSMRDNFISMDVPVIVMSSLGEGDEILKKLNINFEHFIKKPIQFEKLLELVQKTQLNSIENSISNPSFQF
jgi:DNA-binding response OmpR family regulator